MYCVLLVEIKTIYKTHGSMVIHKNKKKNCKRYLYQTLKQLLARYICYVMRLRHVK